MVNYSALNSLKEVGKYLKMSNGYYTFQLKNDEKIIFEEITKRALLKFNLDSNEFIGKNFEIIYSEILEDFEDEDFIIYRIEDLNLI